MIVYKKRANLFFIKILIVSIIFIFISIIFSCIGHRFFGSSSTATFSTELSNVTVIIDAGHGGLDGGAHVGSVFEKDLNLTIARKIADILSCYNIDCVMTRESDVMLANESSSGKKQQDLLNRTKIVKKYEKPVFVSIHMNKFPESRYYGLQVFYSLNDPESKVLAEFIQSNVVTLLQKENNRKIKGAGSSIYVLDRLACPAVLVECGFMSNPQELALLTEDEYQSKLAYVIACSVIDFISNKN